MKKIVAPILAVVLTAAFPVLFLYFRNAAEISPGELWAPLGLFVLIGLAMFGIALLFTRKPAKAAVFTALFLVIFENYTLMQTGIQNLFPSLGYQHILPILLFIAGNIVWLLHSKLKKPDTYASISLILCIVFGGLSLFNGVMAVPDIIKMANSNSEAEVEVEATGSPANVGGEDHPNFYYFIFDEYSNFDIIEKYYGYDNSAYAAYLEEKGFTVSYDSVNESQQTPTILANLFQLNYVIEDSDTSLQKEQARKRSRLQEMLSENGYVVRGLGLASDYMNIPTVSGQQLNTKSAATTMGGDTFMTLLLQNTPVGPFLGQSDGNAEREMVHNVVSYFTNSASYGSKSNIATVTYLKMPHQPFVFTADGGENNLLNWHNWSDPQQYLGQFIYATTIMQEIVEGILANDPEAVIVMQSDHSARSLQSADGTYLIEKFDRRHFFNTVYYAGEPVPEIEGQSGVNTLRLVLSRLLGEDLPVIDPVPVSEFEF